MITEEEISLQNNNFFDLSHPIRGGGVQSLLTNVNKKMVFFNEGFPNNISTRIFDIMFMKHIPLQFTHIEDSGGLL